MISEKEKQIISAIQLLDSIDTKGFKNIQTMEVVLKLKKIIWWFKQNTLDKNEYVIVEGSDVPEKAMERQEQGTETINAGRKVRTNDQKMEEVSGGKPE